MAHSVAHRFWDKVQVAGPDECWEWDGATNKGYGILRGKDDFFYAHRLSLRLAGADPGELHVHHACENRLCVNPAHLELVTPKQHRAVHPIPRRTHCKYGHELVECNVIVDPKKGRSCRACGRRRCREYYTRRRAELQRN